MKREMREGAGILNSTHIRRSIHAISLFLLVANPVAALSVMLRDAEINDRVVRLGDIATFQGASAKQVVELGNAVIGYAPQPGTSRIIPLDTIRVHVLARGFAPSEIGFVGREPVVSRQFQVLPDAEISRAVLEALGANATSGVRFEITRISGTRPLPLGPVTIAVRPPSEIKKNFFVTVDLSVGEESIQTYVTLSAVRIERVVVASRPIERGALIMEKDIQIESRDLLTEPRGVLLAGDRVVGRRAKLPILAGKSIVGNAIEPDLWVKRGEKVSLVVRSRGLELKAIGEAFGAGSEGQTVRVKNLDSSQYVTGKVTAPGEVSVLE